MPIKMIVTDLDGTLFRSDKTISAYTKSIIARCQALGVQFVVATARMKPLVDHFIPDIPLDGYICHNGAVVWYRGSEIASRRIGAASVRATLERIRAHNPDLKLSVQAGDTFYANFDASYMTKTSAMQQLELSALPDLDAEKISILLSSAAEAAQYAPLLDDSLYIVCSENRYGMIMRRDATKQNGVRDIADAAGISPSDIAAFGDDYNDIDMLKACGHAIAVQNAISEVKAIAHDICEDNDHDGLAKWLEAHMLSAL